MELTYDWHSFQSMFFPKRRLAGQAPQGTTPGSTESAGNPAYLVIEQGMIVSAYGDGEDYSDWVGCHYEEMARVVTHRELVLFERKDVDAVIESSLGLAHFYDHTEFLRTHVKPKTVTRKRAGGAMELTDGAELKVNRHFVLEAIASWWAKVLPSSYGLLICLHSDIKNDPDLRSSENLLLIVRRGRVDAFCEPELSTLGSDKVRKTEEVVRYLSEKYLVPVQSIIVPKAAWERWAASDRPWRDVSVSVQANETKLVPFRFSLVGLAATRGFLNI